MSDFFHHLDLSVIDPVLSRPLYELFLGHCGFTLKSAGEDWAGFGLGNKRYPCITLLQARGDNADRKHDRYTSGLHHLALRVAEPTASARFYVEVLGLRELQVHRDEDGTAIVIHAGPDDYKTDPAGDSGNRIACGVVEGLKLGENARAALLASWARSP